MDAPSRRSDRCSASRIVLSPQSSAKGDGGGQTARAAAGGQTAAPPFVRALPDGALVQKYCVTVTAIGAEDGGLSLQTVDRRAVDRRADWEKVVQKLHGGMMPPQGLPRPDAAHLEDVRHVARETVHAVPATWTPAPQIRATSRRTV
jgi:hypothetical protein